MKFEKIPGYQEAKKKIFSMINEQRIGHALALAGEEGSASLQLAIAIAQYMSCENSNQSDSCGNCKSCVKFERNIHPDLHFYYPVTTSKKVPKSPNSQKYNETWLEFLTNEEYASLRVWQDYMGSENKKAMIYVDESQNIIKDLSLKSYESPFRFALIWLPEKMNISTANKLLKFIEEPPEKVFIIFVTENLDQLLPTIISRLQVVRIGKMIKSEMISWLREKYKDADEEKIISAEKNANGNPLIAIQAMESKMEHPELVEDFITWARWCYEAQKKMPEIIDWSDKMGSQKRESQFELLNYGIHFFRAGMLKNVQADELAGILTSETNHIDKFSKLLNVDNGSSLIKAFSKAISNLERYANGKIIFMDLSMKFARLINPKNVHL